MKREEWRTIADIDGEEYEYDNNAPIIVKNPWTGNLGVLTKKDVSRGDADRYGAVMDDELREHLHSQLAPCSDWDFLKAWSELVSTDEVGRVILGS